MASKGDKAHTLQSVHPAWERALRDLLGIEAHTTIRERGNARLMVSLLGEGRPRKPSTEDLSAGLRAAWDECPQVLREHIIALVDGTLTWPPGRPLEGLARLIRSLRKHDWVRHVETLRNRFRRRRPSPDDIAMDHLLTKPEHDAHVRWRKHADGTFSVVAPLETALTVVSQRAGVKSGTLRTWRRDLRRGWEINTPA